VLRLRATVSTLTSSHDSLSTIAHRHGYTDHAHLVSEFRAMVGLPPSAYRIDDQHVMRLFDAPTPTPLNPR